MSDTGSTAGTTRRRVLIGLGVLAVGVIAVAVWWFTRPEPAAVDIDQALQATSSTEDATPETTSPTVEPTAAPSPSPATPTPTATAGAATPTPDAATSPPAGDPGGQAQTWTVTTDAVAYDFDDAAGTFVGFRIDEQLSSIGSNTAVARTPAVSGELTLDDTTVTAAEFTADLTEMTSDRTQRNGAIQRALSTDANPEATFTLTEPADIGQVPPVGEVVEVTVTGDLTVAGQSNTVEIPLQAARGQQDRLVVTGSFDVALSDYGVQAPSAPIVVSVSDTATVELQLYLVR